MSGLTLDDIKQIAIIKALTTQAGGSSPVVIAVVGLVITLMAFMCFLVVIVQGGQLTHKPVNKQTRVSGFTQRPSFEDVYVSNLVSY